MTTQVTKTLTVNVPVSRAYNQWTQFEEFPHFMGGVQSVTQLSDDRLQWVAEIAGVRREWEARILEQVPDRKVAWAATEGATNAGAVTFEDLGGDQTSVTLFLEYEPEGLVEKAGDVLGVVGRQAESDLQRFKEFIEAEGYATGGWRGTVASTGHVGTPGVEDAAESRGDGGKAGLSGKAVAAGLGVAAAATAAVAATRGGSEEGEHEETTVVEVTETPVVEVTEAPVAVEPVLGTTAAAADAHVLTSDEVDAGATEVPLGERTEHDRV
jgi:ribosome-associated toxin RatA of RatAB toxin-antitoxin module